MVTKSPFETVSSKLSPVALDLIANVRSAPNEMLAMSMGFVMSPQSGSSSAW